MGDSPGPQPTRTQACRFADVKQERGRISSDVAPHRRAGPHSPRIRRAPAGWSARGVFDRIPCNHHVTGRGGVRSELEVPTWHSVPRLAHESSRVKARETARRGSRVVATAAASERAGGFPLHLARTPQGHHQQPRRRRRRRQHGGPVRAVQPGRRADSLARADGRAAVRMEHGLWLLHAGHGERVSIRRTPPGAVAARRGGGRL